MILLFTLKLGLIVTSHMLYYNLIVIMTCSLICILNINRLMNTHDGGILLYINTYIKIYCIACNLSFTHNFELIIILLFNYLLITYIDHIRHLSLVLFMYMMYYLIIYKSYTTKSCMWRP